MTLAPIVLFTYNRPTHTRNCIDSLRLNVLASKSILYVFSDGPKNLSDVGKIEEVRNIINALTGFKEVIHIQRSENIGLARNVLEGVSDVLNKWDKVIVIEDDLKLHTQFLTFMNTALNNYTDHSNVFSVSGYSFSDGKSQDSTYFLSFTSSWGWGTWKSKWSKFKNDDSLLKVESYQKEKFDFDNCFEFSSIAEKQLKGLVNSWAIYWYAFVFHSKGLTLYPNESLVRNMGFDGSGTHTKNFKFEKTTFEATSFSLTPDVFEKETNRELIKSSFRKEKKQGSIMIKGLIPVNLKHCLKSFLSKIKILFISKDVGGGSYIDKTVQVLGWNNVSIGSNTLIGEFCWLNVNGRNLNTKQIVIGNNCLIERRNILSSAELLEFSDYVLTGVDCKFLGSNHLFKDPFTPYISAGPVLTGKQRIGANVWLGNNVIVLGSISIGHGSVIGAGSVVTKDIPPFSIAVGNPAKIIKRFDITTGEWIPADNFSEDNLRLLPNEADYLSGLKRRFLNLDLPRIAVSHRFGDLP